ncbi:MAG: NAD-dependent epimerase/dehydratase family protein [Alphaproteobacteria bacterium]|nr:NAD-dependent epimerase/dehydratase family protein [Alphaproteobacteria bacterium]
MTILVTGTAGFIGASVAHRLLDQGREVFGLDTFNTYYDVALKEARWQRLAERKGYRGHRLDIADGKLLLALFDQVRPKRVIHLAAQAGVRYGLDNPMAYVDSNLTGFVNMLEACRAHRAEHLVFASTSSVYGANKSLPYAENDGAAHQVSLYAATKRANEALAHSYAHLFKIPMTGLRFFTVYGPWGRPDMAPQKFTARICAGQAIDVYNAGKLKRDFTFIDDIVEGVVRVLDHLPVADEAWDPFNPAPDASGVAPYRLFNIGRGETIELMDFIATLEKHIGRKAELNMMGMQAGDVEGTWCDVSSLERAVGYRPKVSIDEGIEKTVRWFKDYYKV